MGVYNKNATNPGRPPLWYIRYWVKGEEVRERGGDTRKQAGAFLVDTKRRIKIGSWIHPRDRRGDKARFDNYARSVIAKRVARNVATADKDERGHVENYLIPVFGHLELRELGFKRIKDGFETQINTKKLAGRTVRNIHSTLRAILLEAVEDELLESPPLPLSARRDHLPPPVDKIEDWREVARFEPEEIAKLAGVDKILSLRRVMYLTYFLTGSRVSEILGLRVHHYNRARKPLHALSIHAAKVGRHRGVGRRRREVPVHPDLQAWLDWWLREEYEFLYGKKPQPDDLLFPTLSKRRINAGKLTCSGNELYKQWMRNDLPAAKLRHRKLHDARRTLLSALKNAGVPDDVRRKITHFSVEDRVLDAYTIHDWKLLCDSMKQVEWNIPGPSVRRLSNVVSIK